MRTSGFAQNSFSRSGRPAQDLEFTGERIVPGSVSEALFREHEARYIFAGQYVAGKKVLDIACGTGIGTSYLLKVGAQSCIGLDIDKRTIGYAKTVYPECTFGVSDALDITLVDSSVDVVVSFETIEHVSDQVKFLMECSRVLRSGGLLICSTPNKKVYRWLGTNPFHVREYTLKEFEALLESKFDCIDYYAQAPRFYFTYVARALTSRCLSFFGVKDAVKRFTRWKASPLSVQGAFGEGGGVLVEAVKPLRRSTFVESAYLIGVGRKPPE